MTNDEQLEKVLSKLDMMTSQMNQMQVDMASIKATYHGDIANINHRLQTVETWKEEHKDLESVKHRVGVVESRQDGAGKTITGIIIGIFLAIFGAIINWVTRGGFHG